MPVAFINAGNNTDLTIFEFNKFQDINLAGYESASGYMNDYMWFYFMRNWCGFSSTLADASKFENNEEVEGNPVIYPPLCVFLVQRGSALHNYRLTSASA